MAYRRASLRPDDACRLNDSGESLGRVFPTATNGVTPCSRWHSKPPSAPSYSAGQRCGCCITRRSDPSVGLRFAGGPQVHPRRRLADTRKKMGPFSRPGPNLNELAGSISTYQLKACRRCRGNSSCVRKILGPRSIRGASSGILTSLDLVTIGRPSSGGFSFYLRFLFFGFGFSNRRECA